MPRSLLPALLLGLALIVPGTQAAQSDEARLEAFVAQVARLWEAGRADQIAGLAPRDGRVVLELGSEGSGAVQPRHAAAALRRLFGEHADGSVRATQVTVSGGTPLRGFGELSWTTRPRGVSERQTSVIYLGAVLEEGGWRIHEIRLLR